MVTAPRQPGTSFPVCPRRFTSFCLRPSAACARSTRYTLLPTVTLVTYYGSRGLRFPTALGTPHYSVTPSAQPHSTTRAYCNELQLHPIIGSFPD
ncbi:hypothetical protein NDU88_004228 [Pleurodeles waltl]|uniref:Uncharacterized protein n=1 Tax=Pleurodeles waltl TaxID=8319 RepID=A0AAV7LHG8_PLEWA|nr:hypothetical protein NDU88_004228 [Pleurodeles waltl]